jgi:flagellar biosynthesis protein FliR
MTEFAAYTIWAPTLLLVIARVAGIFLTAPLLSETAIPGVVKAMVAMVLGLAVTARLAAPVTMPGDWVALVLAVGGETLLGATIGFATSLMFHGVELGAEHIGQQMGLSLASVFNPLVEDTTNVLGNMLHLTALVIFLAIGGHRLMVQGLLETFDKVPITGFSMSQGVLDAVVSLTTASFVLAIKVAAPILVTMMLVGVGMGLIQRTMPQLNILSAGFQIRIMVSAVILAVSVASLLPLVQQAWQITMTVMTRLFPAGAS